MSDLVNEIFGGEEEPPNYPGSKKKRVNPTRTIEFVADPWRENFVVKHLYGEEVRMYTIGAFAEALGVSVPTLRSWTASGKIPQAPYRLPPNMIVKGEMAAGRRLYTEEIIDITVHILEKHDLLGRKRIPWTDHPEVPIEIYEAWSKIQQSKKQQGEVR